LPAVLDFISKTSKQNTQDTYNRNNNRTTVTRTDNEPKETQSLNKQPNQLMK